MKAAWDDKTKRYHEMQGKRKRAGGAKWTVAELARLAAGRSDFRFDGRTASW